MKLFDCRRIRRKDIVLTACLFLTLLMVSCGSPKINYSDVMKDDPLHLSQHPPGQALPIDGVWEDPWGEKHVIQAGRMYLKDFIYPMVVLKNVKRLKPGRYSAEVTESKQIQGDDVVIIMVDEKTIVIRTSMTDRTYRALSLFNDEAYAAALAGGKHWEAPTAAKPVKTGPVIHAFKAKPGMVTPGAELSLEIKFTVSDSDSALKELPVALNYRIQAGGTVLYSSKESVFHSPNGISHNRAIRLRAATMPGDYDVIAFLGYQGTRAQQKVSFSVVDQAALEEFKQQESSEPRTITERLVGVWRFEMPGTPKKSWPRWVIKCNGDQLSSKVIMSADFNTYYRMTHHEISLQGGVLRTRAEVVSKPDSGLDCQYTLEGEVTLNKELDYMPVKTKIVDGNYCVRIGEVFKSVMVREE